MICGGDNIHYALEKIASKSAYIRRLRGGGRVAATGDQVLLRGSMAPIPVRGGGPQGRGYLMGSFKRDMPTQPKKKSAVEAIMKELGLTG